jgi:hypothetical protein
LPPDIHGCNLTRIHRAIGVLGYPLYAAGLWYFDVSGNEWFALFGAVMNGIGAGLLFTGAGFVQFAYAEEKEKGMVRFFFFNFYRRKYTYPPP